jgi:hypothetical protein
MSSSIRRSSRSYGSYCRRRRRWTSSWCAIAPAGAGIYICAPHVHVHARTHAPTGVGGVCTTTRNSRARVLPCARPPTPVGGGAAAGDAQACGRLRGERLPAAAAAGGRGRRRHDLRQAGRQAGREGEQSGAGVLICSGTVWDASS